MSDHFLQIDTPENVAFGYELAGLGTRFLAALIDSIIIAVLYLMVLVAGGVIALQINAVSELATSIIAAFTLLIAFVTLWGYYIFFETLWNGQSPGKRILKVRVLRIDGTPISLTEAVIRNLVRIVDFLPLSYGVGVIAMFANKKSRRLGDLAAGTLVVFDQDKVSLDSLGTASKSEAAIRRIEERPILPVERLNEHDIMIIEAYLRKRNNLVNRENLLEDIATRTLEKMELPASPFEVGGHERLLVEILKARRRSSPT